MATAAAKHTSNVVRSPAGRPCSPRSKPISVPATTESARRIAISCHASVNGTHPSLAGIRWVFHRSSGCPYASLLPFRMCFFLVLFQYSPRGHFLCPLPITARGLRALLDVFVLSLFLGAHSCYVLSSWHEGLLFSI